MWWPRSVPQTNNYNSVCTQFHIDCQINYIFGQIYLQQCSDKLIKPATMVSTIGGEGQCEGWWGRGAERDTGRAPHSTPSRRRVSSRRYDQCPRVNSARPRERHGGYLLHGHGSRRLQDVWPVLVQGLSTFASMF